MAKPLLPRFISPRYLLFILVALASVFVIYSYSIYGNQGSTTTTTTRVTTTTTITTTTTSTTATTLPATADNLAISLHADGTSIQGGSVAHEIEFTITGIELYKDGEWVVLTDEAKTVNLIKDTDTLSVIETSSSQGNYEKIKLKMSGGEIWITNDLFYIYTPKRYDLVTVDETEIEHEFELTSEKLELTLNMNIKKSVSRLGLEYKLDPFITVP